MFTGIVEGLGRVEGISARGKLKEFRIESGHVSSDTKIGDSISVNGVCLTVTKKVRRVLIFDVMAGTVSGTNLKYLKTSHPVNLERALTGDKRVGGHFVYGHVDGTRRITTFSKGKDKAYIDIALDKGDRPYIVEKGAIAIDGISLTIGRIFEKKIRIFLIPHTLRNTNLFGKIPGEFVNIEFDQLGKYVLNGNGRQDGDSSVTMSLLRETGFTRG